MIHLNPLFISILFFFLVTQTSSSTHQHDIVHDTCHKCATTDPNINYTLCVNFFDSVPKSHRSNLKGLAIISARIITTNARSITTKLKRILEHNLVSSRYMKSCLEACLELYSDLVFSLKDSAVAIKNGRYDDANMWLSLVVDAPGTCEDGFKEAGIKSPLIKENDDFFGRSVIALSIVAMLQEQGH